MQPLLRVLALLPIQLLNTFTNREASDGTLSSSVPRSKEQKNPKCLITSLIFSCYLVILQVSVLLWEVILTIDFVQAGEDLEEDDDEDKDVSAADLEGLIEEPTESTALLSSSRISRTRSLSRSRRRRGSVSGQGTASFTQAVLMVITILGSLVIKELKL